jgi:hypothetical protein
MTARYLWVNAAIYAIFAALCTVRAGATSRSIGFVSLNNGGMAEYVTVYGGMELGLGLIFAWLAWGRSCIAPASCWRWLYTHRW